MKLWRWFSTLKELMKIKQVCKNPKLCVRFYMGRLFPCRPIIKRKISLLTPFNRFRHPFFPFIPLTKKIGEYQLKFSPPIFSNLCNFIDLWSCIVEISKYSYSKNADESKSYHVLGCDTRWWKIKIKINTDTIQAMVLLHLEC